MINCVKKITTLFALCLTPAVISAQAEKFDVANYECAFEIVSGEQSVRRFTLSAQAYECLRGKHYQDVAVVNGAQQLVPFQVVRQQSDIITQSESRQLEFYQETLSPEVKTADQVRRITQLTGLQAGSETNQQWQLKNSLYSSLIIKKVALKKDEYLGQLIDINLEFDLTAPQTINAAVMIEKSDDLQNWTTLVQRYDVHLLTDNQKINTSTGTSTNNSVLENTTKSKVTIPLNGNGYVRQVAEDEYYLRIAILSNVTDLAEKVSNIDANFEKTLTVLPTEQWLPLELSQSQELDENGQPFWVAHTNSLAPVSKVRFKTNLKTALFEGYLQTEDYKSAFSLYPANPIGKTKVRKVINEVVTGKPKKKPSKRWEARSWFNLHVLQTGNGQISNLTRTLFTRQNPSWRFSFSNPAPMTQAQLPNVEVAWVPVQFNFVAQGDGPFTLLVGGDQATQKLSYPTQLNRLVSTVEQVGLKKLIKINSEKTVEPLKTHAESVPWARYALWGVLFLGLLMMLNMVKQLSKKMKEPE